ncbi:MAG TPA: hypothetical protein VGR35_19400 [Tepidisphaeraceae bacterium]|nr:hypothetical protein [Tepidisphaeraceae bacterium]
MAWYKWKDGVYLGYDWRNPLAKRNYQRHQRQLTKARLARKNRRRDHGPALSARSASKGPQGSLEFRGWSWLCPGCDRAVRILYLPLPPVNLIAAFHRSRGDYAAFAALIAGGAESEDRGSKIEASSGSAPSSTLHPPPSPAPHFACERCHKLRRHSRCDPNFWNEIVTYLTGGLLYGREVKRPDWFPHAKRCERHEGTEARRHEGRDEPAREGCNHSSPSASATPQCLRASVPSCLPRKIPYTPRPNRAPSVRRPQVEKLLLAGRTFRQIAAQLGLAYGTVLWTAQQVYKQHGVRSLPDLLRKHGHTIPPPLTKEVRRRLLAGQTIPQIEAETGAGKTMIYNQRQALRKKGVKLESGWKHNGGRRERRSANARRSEAASNHSAAPQLPQATRSC